MTRRARAHSSPKQAALLAIALLLSLHLGTAYSTRLLRQDVHTRALPGTDPTTSRYRPQQAHEAESQSSAKSTGISDKNASTVAIAGENYPGPRGFTGTHNSEDAAGQTGSSGGAPGFLLASFGPMALAAVDTGRARSIAAPEAMPLMPYERQPEGRAPRYALGSTTAIYSQGTLRKGAGKRKDVYRDSIAVNGLPPLSNSLSGWGDGPAAVAAAGKAVAIANADSPLNGGMERRRRQRLL